MLKGFDSLNQPMSVIKSFYDNSSDMIIKFIKKMQNQPFTLKTDGRIDVQAKLPDDYLKQPKAVQKAVNSTYSNQTYSIPNNNFYLLPGQNQPIANYQYPYQYYQA